MFFPLHSRIWIFFCLFDSGTFRISERGLFVFFSLVNFYFIFFAQNERHKIRHNTHRIPNCVKFYFAFFNFLLLFSAILLSVVTYYKHIYTNTMTIHTSFIPINRFVWKLFLDWSVVLWMRVSSTSRYFTLYVLAAVIHSHNHTSIRSSLSRPQIVLLRFYFFSCNVNAFNSIRLQPIQYSTQIAWVKQVSLHRNSNEKMQSNV